MQPHSQSPSKTQVPLRLFLAAAGALGLIAIAAPAHATAFGNDAADSSESAPQHIERHQVWTFRCIANRTGAPYAVGVDGRDGSLQVKTTRVWTYWATSTN